MSYQSFVKNRVSIIIPTYNYSQYILDAISSVFQQDYLDIEIIVVDDGSTDATRKVLQPYVRRIKYIYQENAGLSAARNTGIAASTGEFVQFLDADDILGVNTVKSQVTYLKTHPEISVAVMKNKLFKSKNIKGHLEIVGSWALPMTNLDVHLCYFNIAPPHAFMFKRQVIMETGQFDTRLTACEDYDYWLRAVVAGFVPHYNPVGEVYYRKHSKSMSSNLSNQYFHDAILHKRLSILLDKYHDFPVNRRLEGLLAFVSGCLLTANRLFARGISGSVDLVKLALKYLEEIEDCIINQDEKLDILIMLFCARIIHYLHMLEISVAPETAEACKMVENILESLGLPLSMQRFFWACMKSVVSGSRIYTVERKELAALTVRELGCRFFCRGSA